MKEARIIVIKCGLNLVDDWVKNMSQLLPDFSVKRWDADYRNDNVEYVIGWCPDALWINGFKNIKAAISIGSGVDHIVNLGHLRHDIPLIRTVSPDLIQRMREFAVLCVLAWHRQFPAILNNNKEKQWKRFAVDTAQSLTVGIMGFGGMGKAIADSLSFMGYKILVWAATKRENIDYVYYYGDDTLESFIEACDVLVCVLPLTTKTQNILNKKTLSKIKPGGCLINLGRGGHLVDDDLIGLIQNSHLSAAFLDGFREEPLPSNSRLWGIENIYITCHSAAYISPESGPRIIAENIRKFDNGETVSHLYNKQLEY